VSLLQAPLAQAQGTPKKEAAPPVPSATFAPVQNAPPSTEAAGAPEVSFNTAEPAPPPPPPVTPPPAVPPVANGEASGDKEALPPGAHLHDGFYMRLGLGIGHISGTTENDSTIKGWGVAPDIWIGGSPIPGLAIGATFSGVSAANPHIEATSADSGGLEARSFDARGTLTYSIFGLFADYYPAPTRGLHFMGGVNYSVLQFKPEEGNTADPASGFGLFGGLGYEWWIGNEWSVGPVARLHWASVSDATGSTSVLSPVFLVGFTYH
jgi:hypothetical protein